MPVLHVPQPPLVAHCWCKHGRALKTAGLRVLALDTAAEQGAPDLQAVWYSRAESHVNRADCVLCLLCLVP